METDFIIEKLILEIEFNSEQEYHQFSSYLQNSLYALLLKELGKILPKIIKNPSENILVEKIELDINLLTFEELNSPQLINQIKKSFGQTQDSRISLYKEMGSSTQINFKEKPSASSNDFFSRDTSHTKDNFPLAPYGSQPKFKKITKEKSLQHYLRTGQFIIGVELAKDEIEQYFQKIENQNTTIHWIEKLPSKTEQKKVLLRLAFQLSSQQKTYFFEQSESVKKINTSFDKPIILSENNKKELIDPSVKNTRPESIIKEKDSQSSLDSKSNQRSFQRIIKHKEILKKEEILNLDSNEFSKEITLSENEQLSLDQGLYVKTAGIVIVAPYLNALFQKSGLLDIRGKSFKNKYCIYYAIHLLAFLANKSVLETEDNCLLYKLLCGLPLDAPIATQIEVAQEDKDRVDRLLLQVVRKWEIKFGDQIDLLRGSFFIRDGKLSKVDGKWLLQVETKSFDSHLFKKMSWSFKLIKLPWMADFLSVDWY